MATNQNDEDAVEEWEEQPKYPNGHTSWEGFAESFIPHAGKPFMLLLSRVVEYRNQPGQAVEKTYVFGIAHHHCFDGGAEIVLSPMSFSSRFVERERLGFKIFHRGLDEKSLFLSDDLWIVRYKIEEVCFDITRIDDTLAVTFDQKILGLVLREYVDVYSHVWNNFLKKVGGAYFPNSFTFFQNLKDSLLLLADGYLQQVEKEIVPLKQKVEELEILKGKLD